MLLDPGKSRHQEYITDMESSSTSSSISSAAIQAIVDRLKVSRHRKSTGKIYYSVWRTFNEFFIKLDVKPLTWEERIVLFVGHLIDRKRQSATIKSYISAIKAVLQDDCIYINQDEALLSSLTRACRLENDRVHTRLPIRQGMLEILIRNVPNLFQNDAHPYLVALYIAMLSTAYFGLLRVGEITRSEHTLKVGNVKIGENKRKLLLKLDSSKTHGQDSMPQIIKIVAFNEGGSHMNSHSEICLLRSVLNYIVVRKKKKSEQEPFFIFKDRTPVTAYAYRKMLKKLLKISGFNEHFYNTHSTRAGRAIDLYRVAHLSLETIRKIGHWRSSSIYTYLQTTF